MTDLIPALSCVLASYAEICALQRRPDNREAWIVAAERRYEVASASLAPVLATASPVEVAEVAPLLRILGCDAPGDGVPLARHLASYLTGDDKAESAIRRLVNRWVEDGPQRTRWAPLYEMVYTP